MACVVAPLFGSVCAGSRPSALPHPLVWCPPWPQDGRLCPELNTVTTTASEGAHANSKSFLTSLCTMAPHTHIVFFANIVAWENERIIKAQADRFSRSLSSECTVEIDSFFGWAKYVQKQKKTERPPDPSSQPDPSLP